MGIGDVTFDSTRFTSVLKIDYLGPTRDVLNSKRILLNRLVRDEENVSGSNVYCPLRVGRNEGQGSVGRGGRLPEPGQQKYANTSTTTKQHYMRIMVPGPEMADSRDSRGAFLQLLDGEMVNGTDDCLHETNRKLYGNGSGALCIATVLAAPTYTAGNAGGYTNKSNGTLYLREGMTVVAIDPATGNVRGTARKIASVNASAGTFTTTGNLGGIVANDYIVRASEVGVTPDSDSCGYNNEFMGIRGIVADIDPPTIAGGLQGLAVATNAFWKSTVLGNSGVDRPLTLPMLQEAEDQLDIDADAAASIWLSGHAQRRAYLNLLESSKRFVNNMTLDGGFKALEYNEVPWVVDKDCPDGLLYGLDEDQFRIFQQGDWFWLSKDNAILSRLDDYDIYQAALAWYAELATMNRRAALVIEDLD
uniref:Capsid protein n=1 Tax=uncultured marine virus TaxID=186617 RepID=A0A0F7L1U5_9VIRU|nr:hypothetical protein [uncultured marine virus]